MNQPMAAATSLNNIPLPAETVLVPGDYYGMKLPEYHGDPVMLQPYSLVQFDLPEGYVYIRALTENTYEVVNHAPEVAGDMDRVNGLIPMATERDVTDNKQLPRRTLGLGDPATQPNIMVTDSSGAQGAAGLMNPATSAAQAPQTPADPAAAAAPPPPAGGDDVPSGNDPLEELAGTSDSKKGGKK